jgi:hypothetical protein
MPFQALDFVSEKECRRKEQRFFIGNDARWTRGWDVDMFAYLMSFETDRLSTRLELQRVLRSFFLRTFPKRFPSWPALAPATYESPRSSSHFLAYYPHTFGHQWAGELGDYIQMALHFGRSFENHGLTRELVERILRVRDRSENRDGHVNRPQTFPRYSLETYENSLFAKPFLRSSTRSRNIGQPFIADILLYLP